MRAWLKPLALLLSIGYPFIVYGALQGGHYWLLFLILPLLLMLRALSGISRGEGLVLALVLTGMALAMYWGDQQLGFKFYPVMMNLGFLGLFSFSLWQPPTVIERIARLHEPDLPDSARPYLRRVTQVWCGFFILNGSIALATTLWGSDELWLLYNGCISYLLIGTLLGGEWLIRRRVRHG